MKWKIFAGIGLGILIAVGFCVVITLGIIVHGFVLSKLWEWFIVPQFQLAPLSIPVAAGIGMFTTTITGISQVSLSQAKNRDKTTIVALIILPFCTLILGYILQLFI